MQSPISIFVYIKIKWKKKVLPASRTIVTNVSEPIHIQYNEASKNAYYYIRSIKLSWRRHRRVEFIYMVSSVIKQRLWSLHKSALININNFMTFLKFRTN